MQRIILFFVLTAPVIGCSHSDSETTRGPEFHIARAKAFGEAENWDRVIAECDEAVRLNPDSIDAYQGRAAAYYQKGLWNNAVSNYNEVVRLDPKGAEVYSYLGYAYSQLSNYDKAVESFTKFLDLGPGSVEALRLRGFAYVKKGDLDKAIRDYGEAIKLDPKHASTYVSRGRIYAAKSDLDKAINDLNEAIRLQSTNAQAYFFRGCAYDNKGDFEKAEADVVKSAHIDPNNPTVLSYLNGLAWQLASSPESSIRNGEKSVELAKKACDFTKWSNWRFLDTLAAAYAEAGDFDNAVKYQNMAIAKEGLTETGKRAGLKLRLDMYKKKMPYREN